MRLIASVVLPALAAITATASTPEIEPALYPCALLIQWDPHAPRAPMIRAAGDRQACSSSARMALLTAQLRASGAQ